MAATPVSSATEHAAEVTADALCGLSTMGCDEHRNANGDDCLSLLWYHELGEHIAQALAAAGLLCTPQERAVIDAAKYLDTCAGGGLHLNPSMFHAIRDLCAAVDRLAAPGLSHDCSNSECKDGMVPGMVTWTPPGGKTQGAGWGRVPCPDCAAPGPEEAT